MKNRDDNKPDTPAVRVPPPVIVAVLLLTGLVVDGIAGPGPDFSPGPRSDFGDAADWLFNVGIGLCVFGFGIVLWCAVLYRKAKTSILPHIADSNIIDSGPFGRSRNPIYLSMLIVFVGVCFIADAPAALVFIVPTYLALRYYVIAREEAYLIRRFGDEYSSYQSRVRRWI